MEEQDLNKERAEGLSTLDAVYGNGTSERLEANASLIAEETIAHLFGKIWSRPGLSIRDRRLLTMGATAAAGRPEKLTIQAIGALINHELTFEELREAALHLAYYVGWEKGTDAAQAFEEAIKKVDKRYN